MASHEHMILSSEYNDSDVPLSLLCKVLSIQFPASIFLNTQNPSSIATQPRSGLILCQNLATLDQARGYCESCCEEEEAPIHDDGVPEVGHLFGWVVAEYVA